MPPRTLTPEAPLIQGVMAPNIYSDPDQFYPATRRLTFAMRSRVAIAGLGTTDAVQLRQTGIVDVLEIRVDGSLVFGGTIAGTSMSYEWPFNLPQEIRLSANGQSNLVRCRGLTIRALEFIRSPDLNESGAAGTFGATAVTAGTLKLACDDWGTSGVNSLNPGASVAATGTYTVDLTFHVPVSADQVTLIGSVFAQSQATNLTLEVLWATQAQLLTLGGAATFSSTLFWSVTGRAYSIPNVGGRFVVPDLSMFHQIAETRVSGIGQGINEHLLPGTGVGRRLMRLLFNVYSSAAPLAMTDANYSQESWAYGGNDVPEQYLGGTLLRAANIRLTGTDLGGRWGLGLWDFASQFVLRDLVDEGATADLRLAYTLVGAPSAGAVQIAQETLFAAPVGA